MKNVEHYKKGYFMPPVVDMSWTQKEYPDKAPIWCSVDLRDGNQALIIPMSLEEKIEFYKVLVGMGFKEIEVGFPAASETEFEFLRYLVDHDMIPDDVTVQVLTQAREHIIRKTFDALKGVKNAIVHVYNSTSFAQRQQVFRKSKEEIKQIAVDGAKLLQRLTDEAGANFRFEYSPESFTGTEPEYALEVCNAVLDVWKPTADRKAIINLPSTVQMSMPHVFASQIAYMSQNLKYRDNVILSVHPHNDRGTGVADAEMAMLAGADRVEGTLFGNGERTGNADIVTIGMNMYALGVDPGLDFSNMPKLVETYERVTRMHVHPRQPYAGQLVFAAFSGSHQDAIAKGMKFREETDPNRWTVPYLPIDPHDVGREYDGDVIRINSQSGKGGVAYLIQRDHGFDIPKAMRSEVGYMMKDISDRNHEELSSDNIFEIFRKSYVNYFAPLDITDAEFTYGSSLKDEGNQQRVKVDMRVVVGGKEDENKEIYNLTGTGNGRMDAVSNALQKTKYNFNYKFITYSEHALSQDSNSKAAAYICIEDTNGRDFWGVGTHDDIILASVNALVSAINRMNDEDRFMN